MMKNLSVNVWSRENLVSMNIERDKIEEAFIDLEHCNFKVAIET